MDVVRLSYITDIIVLSHLIKNLICSGTYLLCTVPVITFLSALTTTYPLFIQSVCFFLEKVRMYSYGIRIVLCARLLYQVFRYSARPLKIWSAI